MTTAVTIHTDVTIPATISYRTSSGHLPAQLVLADWEHLEPILITTKIATALLCTVITCTARDRVKFVSSYVVNRECRKRLAANITSGACAVTTNILSFNTALSFWITLFGTAHFVVRPLCSYRHTRLPQREIPCCLHLSRKRRSIFTPVSIRKTN